MSWPFMTNLEFSICWESLRSNLTVLQLGPVVDWKWPFIDFRFCTGWNELITRGGWAVQSSAHKVQAFFTLLPKRIFYAFFLSLIEYTKFDYLGHSFDCCSFILQMSTAANKYHQKYNSLYVNYRERKS